MKKAHIIIFSLSVSLATHVFAAVPFNPNPTILGWEGSISGGIGSVKRWRTNPENGNLGKQLANNTTISGQPSSFSVYGNTYLPDLKPKGSEIAHAISGNDGYIDGVWNAVNGSNDRGGFTPTETAVLFATKVSPSQTTYLYKLNPSTGTVGNNPPAFDNKQAVLNIGERTDSQGNAVPRNNVGILTKNSLLAVPIIRSGGNPGQPSTVTNTLYFAEYNTSNQGGDAIWKSTDLGATWSKVIEWNTVGHQIGSIHGLKRNPFNNMIYILCGDSDTDSGIIAWDGVSAAPPDNTPLQDIANGTYTGWKALTGLARAVSTSDLYFEFDTLYWIPDVHSLPANTALHSQTANADLTGLQETGIVPYSNGFPPMLASTFPQSSIVGDFVWTSGRDANAAEQKVYVWETQNAGLNWTVTTKVDVHNNSSATPFSFNYPYIQGRELEFVSGGQSQGSTVDVTYPTSQNLLVTVPDTFDITSAFNTIEVINNDGNQAQDLRDAQIVIASQPQHGYLVPTSFEPNSFIINYIPDEGYSGSDSFSYALKNAVGTSNTSTVILNVTSSYPIANPDTATVNAGEDVNIDVLANDTNLSSTATVDFGAPPINGILTPISNTTFNYKPNPGFSGQDSFTYGVWSNGYRVETTVTVNVIPTTPPPSTPVANPDSYTTKKGEDIKLNLTSNDTNVGNSKVSIVTQPASGKLKFENGNKTLAYKPNSSFIGMDSFTYQLKNNKGVSNTATVTITVTKKK